MVTLTHGRRISGLPDERGRLCVLARMTPDPHRDVMVYQVAMIDALSGVSIGDRWTVWLGQESEGSFGSEGEAMAAAAQLADDHGRPGWLIKDGGETIPI